MKHLYRSLLLTIWITAASTVQLARAEQSRLWYDRPATNWSEALPIGNGRLGAMVFGDPTRERLQLNEESLWAGCPTEAWPADYFKHLEEVRRLVLIGRNTEASTYGVQHLSATPTSFRSYEPLGDLWLDFSDGAGVSNFRRELDLADGIARTSWRRGEATLVREVFISAPDDVLVARIATDVPGTLSFGISLTRERQATVTVQGADHLKLDGQIIDVEKKDGGYEDNPGLSGPGGAHMRFAARLVVRVNQGEVKGEGDKLRVIGATEALVFLTAATDYDLSKLNFDRSIDPGKESETILRRAAKKPYAELLNRHRSEHRTMFNRVSVRLGEIDPAREELTTDARLAAVKKGADDAGLVALHFQFGRYLLMGSSRRPGRLPANLQGIWNDRMWAPWESDYHLNINLQMNYWPAGPANLAETVEPLLDWFQLLAKRGEESARRLYESDGWVAFLATNPFGRITPSASTLESQFLNASLDPMCGAWMAAQLFDHYQFTADRKFLARVYPVLRGASEFVLDTLVPTPNGALVMVPSTSPENQYIHPETKKRIRITAGSTYHMSLVRAIFDATDRAAAILGKDEKTRKRIAEATAKLPPLKLGPDGRILEWAEPYEEAEPGHRHVSHLVGLHPFDLITPATPELFAGARKVLDYRLAHGGAGTGWSRAWTVNFFARLQDGDAAREHYRALLSRSTMPNLLDTHPPFQIDGNFGGTAGLAEMLLQSHERTPGSKPAEQQFVITLLPALPKAWSSGSVKGLRARGSTEAAFDWKDGKVTSYRLTSASVRQVPVRVNGELRTVNTERWNKNSP